MNVPLVTRQGNALSLLEDLNSILNGTLEDGTIRAHSKSGGRWPPCNGCQEFDLQSSLSKCVALGVPHILALNEGLHLTEENLSIHLGLRLL